MDFKKNFKLLSLITIIIYFFYFLLKSYNPTTYGWQNDLVTYLAKLTDIVYLSSHFKSHSLPIYNLSIKTENFLFLDQNLPDPKKTRGILTDEYKKYTSANIEFQDQSFDVKVRYRGYDFDHWTRDKKSWRIKFDQVNPLFNQKSINLIIPEDRGIYLEELSNFRAKKMGLIVPESQFIVLNVNENNHGIYWQAGHWNQNFLVKNNLPMSKLYGEIDQPNKEGKQSIFTSTDYWKDYLDQDENKSELKTLLDLLNQPDDQKFFFNLPQILDIDNFLTWQSHSVLMGSNHQDTYHNIRLYYHPELKKFFIFPWDVLGGLKWLKDYNPLVTRVLKNPLWLSKRNKILTDYVSNPDNLDQDLQFYDQLFNQTKVAFLQDSFKYFSNYGYLKQVAKTRQQLIDQFQLVKNHL